jgi:signal transduction histidine kinase
VGFTFNFYTFFLFLAALPTAAICYVLIQKQGASKHFGFLMGASAIWAIGYGFELMSSDLNAMLFWIRIEYIGIALIPAYLIQFTLAFTGRESTIHLTNQIAWFFIPVVTLILASTTPLHGMHYETVSVDTSGPFPMLAFERGPWYWIHTAYFYAAMVWNLHELTRWYRKSDGLYQQQTAMIILGALMPWFVNLMYLLGYRPFAYLDLTPFAFLATGFVIAYGLMRFRLFELVPIARDKVIEGMSDGVMVLDTLDRVVDSNPMMRRILKEYNENLIGKHPSELLPSATELKTLIDQHQETRAVISIGTGESKKTMQIQVTPIFDKTKNNTRSGMLLLWRDITEQERFEQELIESKKKAEESDRLKTAFLANMSHEIRNPMHAIMGFTEILRDPNTSEHDRVRYTDIISQSAQKLLTLINDIIDLSKVEAGQDPLVLESGEVNALIDEVKVLLSPMAKRKSIELTISEMLPETESFIESDFRKLRQILINLISNAIKYTDQGSVTVSVHHLHPHLFFTVKDTGIGMDSKTLSVIFERFRQSDTKSARHIGGTGLGLSISKAYSELLGGVISVDSTFGKGSTFTLRIPYKPGMKKQAEPIPIAEPNAYVMPDLSAFSILLAEDEPVNVKFLQIILKKTNANVIVANNGLEALNIALDQNISLILMDIMMPEMDGFEASKRIRKQKPNLPILGLSGHAMVEESRIIDAGITELLTKPIQGKDLIRKLEIYLTKTHP